MANEFIIKHGTIIHGQAYTPTYDVSTGYTSTTINIDFDNSNVQTVMLSGNTPMTLANATNIKKGGSYMVVVKQDSTGSSTLSYGGYYLWEGGTAPTITATANAIDVLSFVCFEYTGGTSALIGTYSQNFTT